MATSIASARQKFERKMAGSAGAKYDAAKGSMAQNYAEGLRAIGVTVGPLTQRSYQEGISAVSGQEVASRAAASSGKWERNYLASMSR